MQKSSKRIRTVKAKGGGEEAPAAPMDTKQEMWNPLLFCYEHLAPVL